MGIGLIFILLAHSLRDALGTAFEHLGPLWELIWVPSSMPLAILIGATVAWARQHDMVHGLVGCMAFVTTFGGATPVLVPLLSVLVRWYRGRWWWPVLALLCIAPMIPDLIIGKDDHVERVPWRHPIWTHVAIMVWCDQWHMAVGVARQFQHAALTGLLLAFVVALLNHLIGLFIVVVLIVAPLKSALRQFQARL